MNKPESWIRGHGFIEYEARLPNPTLNVAQWGYNAATDHFEDLIESGIIDPAKVVRAWLCKTLLSWLVCSSRRPGRRPS